MGATIINGYTGEPIGVGSTRNHHRHHERSVFGWLQTYQSFDNDERLEVIFSCKGSDHFYKCPFLPHFIHASIDLVSQSRREATWIQASCELESSKRVSRGESGIMYLSFFQLFFHVFVFESLTCTVSFLRLANRKGWRGTRKGQKLEMVEISE